jgi:D-amino-acid dehydrogenase
VLAIGSFTPLLLRSLGIRLPIYPVKGISLTVPAAPWPDAVKMPVIDDSSGLFGPVPIGDRLRVSGSAEITGYGTTPSPVRGQAVVDNVLKTFPDFARCYDRAGAKRDCGRSRRAASLTWAERRSAIYSSMSGTGTLGWTMSCGAGQVVASIVAGKQPDIDLSGFPIVQGVH